MGQNPYIQLAVFEVPQLCQFLELEAHLWTGNSGIPRYCGYSETIEKIVLFQFFYMSDHLEHPNTQTDLDLTKPFGQDRIPISNSSICTKYNSNPPKARINPIPSKSSDFELIQSLGQDKITITIQLSKPLDGSESLYPTNNL